MAHRDPYRSLQTGMEDQLGSAVDIFDLENTLFSPSRVHHRVHSRRHLHHFEPTQLPKSEGISAADHLSNRSLDRQRAPTRPKCPAAIRWRRPSRAFSLGITSRSKSRYDERGIPRPPGFHFQRPDIVFAAVFSPVPTPSLRVYSPRS